ncbi:hypothetical protein CPB86DRAFT_877762 [Serendipita vermifera]|nr:hypothetical protein CPB86DRAFT_877762 [Serendipita vermifera]
MKDLPYEIWLTILEMAVRPELLMDLKFEPLDIEIAYLCLKNQYYCSQYAAQMLVSRNKRKLRGVCQLWNAMLDSIEIPKKWIMHDFGHYERTSPLDTSKTARLNQEYQPTGKTMASQIRFSHPVSTLTLSFLPLRSKTTEIPPLSDIVSFQDQLRVLDIQWHALCRASRELLTDIQVMAISLTTLGLTIPCNNARILRFHLQIPTLVSLFVTLPRCSTPWKGPWPEYDRWYMPSLRNLSLTGGLCDTHSLAPRSYPFFLRLLETHFDIIRALRIHPMIKEVYDQGSPVYWARMPDLRSLATDFTWKESSVGPGVESTEFPVVKSSSVRHLIHIAAGFNHFRDVVAPIGPYILACNQLQSVSLVDPYKRYQEMMTEGGSLGQPWIEAMKGLQELCDENRVKLCDQDGKEFHKKTELSRGA